MSAPLTVEHEAELQMLRLNEAAARTARAKAAVYRIALDDLIACNEIIEGWHKKNNKPYLNVGLDKARKAIAVLDGVNAPGECMACDSSGEVETVGGETVACPYCLAAVERTARQAAEARATEAEAKLALWREVVEAAKALLSRTDFWRAASSKTVLPGEYDTFCEALATLKEAPDAR